MNTIEYWTADEVYRFDAQQIAKHEGFVLRPVYPGGAAEVSSVPVVYALDSIESKSRASLVAQLTSQPWSRPTGVHSYWLDDAQIQALRRQGIVVFRRLEPELFALVLDNVNVPPPGPETNGPDDTMEVERERSDAATEIVP